MDDELYRVGRMLTKDLEEVVIYNNLIFIVSINRLGQHCIATFNEWFSNTTFATVRKNLRTTTGKHVIEIDEHIL